MIIDDYMLAIHQKIFDRIEYRWELTTAQVAEIALMIMWGLYAVKHILSQENVGWLVYIIIMSLLTVYYCKKTDVAIRADRKTDALVTLEVRKWKVYVFLRVFMIFFTAAFLILFGGDILNGDWKASINAVGAVLNLFAVYVFNCINDVDGTKRRAMEYEEAEKMMAKEHARW